MKINTMKIFPEFIKDSFASDIFIFIQYSYFHLRSTYFASSLITVKIQLLGNVNTLLQSKYFLQYYPSVL